jgi:uncharacterized membrane protein
MRWAHAGTAVLAAFRASLVEVVEALTTVLAERRRIESTVGTFGGIKVD